MIDRLRSSGWVSHIYAGEKLCAHLIDVAKQLGTPLASRRKRSPVEILTPIEMNKAKPSSPSRMFGLGALPLHTDTAHWIEPCRYIVLGCVSPGQCGRKTVLADSSALDINEEMQQILRDCQYRVLNGRRSFFASVQGPEGSFFRFDQACMVPIDVRSRIALERVGSAVFDLPTEKVNWVKGQVLVIDNWRILHGRSDPSSSGVGRVLARVMVK
jgi:alpha-ketoglutarate-dependent taurine dioxygenase